MGVLVTSPEAAERVARLEQVWQAPPRLIAWLTTVDHKTIGKRYFVTSSLFFLAAGVEALLMRTQLARPDSEVLSPGAFNELFSMHGITMIFLFVTPMLSGAFGNYLVPLQIGARDMAFPRMNALSYWIYLAAGTFMYMGLFTGRAPNVGWFNYVPLAGREYTPGLNDEFYNLGLIFLTISSTIGATNFIVTILKLRAPGMSINRLPIFCWSILATSFSLVFALPALTAANVMLELDRLSDFHFFDHDAGGDPVLWQHLFWIFGHPDVYIIVLPALGIVSAIVPAFTGRRIVARDWVALSTVLTALIGFGVWVHHMFAVGLPQITMVFFAAASLFVVVPSGIQIFAWCATLVRGRPRLETPLLYVLGFLVTFVIGGVTGIMFAAIPFDQQTTDSYFVVAHFHYVLFGGAVFPLLGGIHFWYPKVTGRMLTEPLAQIGFWLVFVGFNLTFFPMHIAGLFGMPRRIYTYHAGLGWDAVNLASTIGAYLLASGFALVLFNMLVSRVAGARAGSNPWNADTLEWTTASPPPDFDYPVIPVVRSPEPAWDLEARAEEKRRLERGELVLDAGHETPATTELDAELEAILEMPPNSPWPLVLTLTLAALFSMLLLSHFVVAGIFAGLGVLVAAAWQSKEPGAPTPVRPDAVARASGWWGMAVLVATEATLFAVLIASYFYLRFETVVWPPSGTSEPKILVPLVLTGVLVTTSVPMALASGAAQRGKLWQARLGLFFALFVGSGYLVWQIHRLVESLETFRPQENAYASLVYTLAGGHHAHVALALLFNLFLLWRLRHGLTTYRVNGIRAVAFYWHFVNVLALAVTATLLSPAL